MSGHELPLDEPDYSKWPDSTFQALTPDHVKFFDDENVQKFYEHLREHWRTTLRQSTKGTETLLAFSDAYSDASQRRRDALDKKIEETRKAIEKTAKEFHEYKELTGEYNAAMADEIDAHDKVNSILNDPELAPDVRARKLAKARAVHVEFKAEIVELEKRLAQRGWLSCMSALSHALCERVENPPKEQPSSLPRTWGLEFQRLEHWTDFDAVKNLRSSPAFGLRMNANPFVTYEAFDASESEKGCAMMMYARSEDPLLQHVFGHRDKPFGDLKMALKFEHIAVLGARPDQLWLAGKPEWNGEMRPLLVHEHKKPAVFPARVGGGTAPRLRIWEYGMRTNDSSRSNDFHQGVSDVLQEAYGYMITLGLRYGAISTTEYTWFLKRADDNSSGTQTPAGLLVSSAYPCTRRGSRSLHRGYLTALLHALRDDSASGQFPGPGTPLGLNLAAQWREALGDTKLERGLADPFEQRIFAYLAAIQEGKSAAGGPGDLLPLQRSAMAGLLPVPWDEAYERVRESAASSVLRLRRPDGLAFFIKTAVVGGPDGLSAAEVAEAAARETRVYAALAALQGSSLAPMVYGGALMDEDRGGWHAVITLDVGTSLDQLAAPLAEEVQTGALAALARVHAAGCLLGDVALRKFVLCPNTGAVRVIGFAGAQLVSVDSAEAKRGAAAEIAHLRDCLGLAQVDAPNSRVEGASSSTKKPRVA